MSNAEQIRNDPELFPDDDQLRVEAQEHKVEVGRLVEPESGVDELDHTAEPVASDVGPDDGDLSAEEAAMHLTDEP
jgi:hypothetical protein